MHISWYWIKQRPHFLAIYLSDLFKTDIVYPKSIRHFWAKRTIPPNCMGIFQFPLSRFSLIKKINVKLYRNALHKKLKSANVVWFGNPEDFIIVADLIPANTMVVYDCMDDLLEFPGNQSQGGTPSIEFDEGKLVIRADRIIASSFKLKEVIINRYQTQKNIEIVNNAIDNSFLELILKLLINY